VETFTSIKEIKKHSTNLPCYLLTADTDDIYCNDYGLIIFSKGQDEKKKHWCDNKQYYKVLVLPSVSFVEKYIEVEPKEDFYFNFFCDQLSKEQLLNFKKLLVLDKNNIISASTLCSRMDYWPSCYNHVVVYRSKPVRSFICDVCSHMSLLNKNLNYDKYMCYIECCIYTGDFTTFIPSKNRHFHVANLLDDRDEHWVRTCDYVDILTKEEFLKKEYKTNYINSERRKFLRENIVSIVENINETRGNTT